MQALWQLPIIDGPVPWIVFAVAIALLLIVVIRRPTPGNVLGGVIGFVAGAIVGIAAYAIANALNSFGDPLPREVGVWGTVTLAGVGLAVSSLWRSPVWRKIIAVCTIIWLPIAGVVGVNGFYGLNPTLGSLLGISGGDPISIPTPGPTATNAGPLYKTWKPPADMPATGKVGSQSIPSTVSGFAARDAGIYLPPAALVADPPALPLVILMMGYPGNPDPSYVASVLDGFAAKNNGLAPIVVVADQIGSGGDPACADSSAYGNAKTYIKTDVVNWAKANLHVIQDPKSWVIAGYSNGGGCAITYGAEEPDVFKNIIDISGEPFPGSEDPDAVIAQIYGGDNAKFEAVKPVNILAANKGKYDGVTAVFTAGSEDPTYLAAAQTVSDAARAAGMTVTSFTVQGAGHVGDALTGGLQEGFTVLYPVLGLSAP